MLLLYCYVFLTDQFPQLLELFHSLDSWHKAKKLTKCLHRVGCFSIFLFKNDANIYEEAESRLQTQLKARFN